MKALRINRKRTMLLLKIDVEVEGIRRKAILPEPRCNLAHSALGLIAEARLLISKCPEGRQRRRSGDPGISRHDLLWLGTINKVVVDRPMFRAK